MISLWPSTITSLNDSLDILHGSIEKLKAAQPIDVAEVAEQCKVATESSRNLRALVLSELPEAAWTNREELRGILEDIQKRIEERHIEQQRSRLVALAAELEAGRIVHRRAARVTQMNQLREEAINELMSEASRNGAPQSLPGPEEADEWLEWACGLQEPDDTASLEALRNRFTHLDAFVANLEPNMWTMEKEAEV